MTTQDTSGDAPARRPTGRDDVQNAILDAATELFTGRSPSNVSLREIARRAGVNYGLIHHYYGSKEAIVGEVFRRKSENGALIIADAPDIHEALRRIMGSPDSGSAYARLLAGALAEGATSELFFQSSPAITRLVELIEAGRDGGDGTDARVVAAAAMTLVAGWGLYEKFFIHAAGLEDRDPAEIRAEIADLVDVLVRGTRPAD
jgi:AcrR family transcriptional regulator